MKHKIRFDIITLHCKGLNAGKVIALTKDKKGNVVHKHEGYYKICGLKDVNE